MGLVLIVSTISGASAVESEAAGLDQVISDFISPVTNQIVSWVFFSVTVGSVAIPLIVVWLMLGAVFFTGYFGFINVIGFRHAIDLVRGKFDDPDSKGEVSHFQALSTALSGTVGLGNIAGVAVAISVGGPGATFWMILAGVLGMSTKFVECTLGVQYRSVHSDGSVSGGPMYYLSKGFGELGHKRLGICLAGFFAICCIMGSLGGGNMFQANQAFKMFLSVTGGSQSFFADKGWLFGGVLAAFVGFVIIGGVKSIAKVTVRLVPFMGVLYVLSCLIILLSHIDQLWPALQLILTSAFVPEGVAGGALGVLLQGFKRSAFSNEAGIGSAAIAHAAVKTNQPVSEGIVSLLEPFIDTVVVCTMTALVITVTGSYSQALGGVELTSHAFASVFSWFPIFLVLAVIIFAVSTMLSWSYYGLKAWTYLFGHGRRLELAYKALFCAFIVIGCTMDLDTVVDFSDAAIFAMSVANLIGLYALAPRVKRLLQHYRQQVMSE